MVTKKDIQATCDDIVREFAPLQVILFGSHAYGTPTKDSDVDLLVVMDIPESETTRQAGEIWQRIPRRFSMDLLVRSPKEIAYRISHNDWFLHEITERGKVLYESIGFTYNKEDKKGTLIKEEFQANPLTLEWAQKAERDYAAITLHQQVASPDFDLICFHAQQCIEKYLKAWIQETNITFPKSHDLMELLVLILPSKPSWQIWQKDFEIISPYAVEFRYPGKSATVENAEHVVQTCNIVRHEVRKSLKLSQVDSEN